MSDLGCYTSEGTSALDCAVQGLFGAMFGEAVFALVLAGVLAVSLYVATNGGIAVPATLLTLLGAFLLTSIPAQYRTTAGTIMFIGMVSGVLALANKYVME